MKLLAGMLFFLFSFTSGAQEAASFGNWTGGSRFERANALFSEGKYQATVQELESVEAKLTQENNPNRSLWGLAAYWKGISQARLQNYPAAIESFERAIGYEYKPEDIHYEYGQALFASEKLTEARLQFRESVKRKFKRGVSLYYIGYISRELRDYKKAVTFFKAIDKLGPEEKADVKQAAEMQIADIYLLEMERHRDAFRAVEKYVIPQYEVALRVNPESNLAPIIREKIVNLQRKYDLILFNLRNGRPVLNPPYFLRLSMEAGVDTNVTFAPTETTIAKSRQSSAFGRTDAIGRYTFYHRNYLSVAPELRFNYTRYLNRVPEIHRNDNSLIAPALRTAYEHTLWKKPASVLLDYEYSEARRDINAKKELEFSSRSHVLMLGERFNFFETGESIVRLRRRIFQSFDSSSDATTTSFVFEQIVGLKTNTLLFFLSYDRTRVDNSLFDTNAVSFRADFIAGRIWDLFTPSVGLGLTSSDPVNNRAVRGRELLVNPSARVSRMFGKSWRGNLKYDWQKLNSRDERNFAFKKQIYSAELEYLF
jgi:tetratricopeptide (TPR) repeat protein